jgi:hypothetical protein
MPAPVKLMRSIATAGQRSSSVTSGASTYTIGLSWAGNLPPNYPLVIIPLDQAVSYAANLSPSQGILETATTASLVITFYANGTLFGTMTFAAGATVATFAGGSVSYPVGTLITAITPMSTDATASNLGFTLSGQKVTAA